MADFSRDTDIGYPDAPIDILIAKTVTIYSTILTVIESITANTSVSEQIVLELQNSQEWNAGLSDDIIEKLETIRVINVATVSSIGTVNTSIQSASNLSLTQGANILAALQSLGLSTGEIDHALSSAVEELKKLSTKADLIIGEGEGV